MSIILKSLKNNELCEKFTGLVATERKVCHLVLQYISEIDRRKLYLEMAYPSLFEFLVKAHGFSEGAAQRRIASARLMQEIPEISTDLQNGNLNLSQLAQVQQAVRLVKKTQRRNVNLLEKSEILKKIKGSSKVGTQKILSESLTLPIPEMDREQHHRDERVTLTLTFSAEEMAILQKAKELSSNATASLEWKDLLVHLARKQIVALGKVSKKRPTQEDKSQRQTNSENSTAAAAVNMPEQKCEYRDRKSQRICGAKTFLNKDHIQPKWDGGDNSPENLQNLCASHNRWRYHRQSNTVRI